MSIQDTIIVLHNQGVSKSHIVEVLMMKHNYRHRRGAINLIRQVLGDTPMLND